VTALDQRIEILFAPLRNKAASFPSPAELTTELISVAASTSSSVTVSRSVSALFASAAVEMWLRAVHSFFDLRVIESIQRPLGSVAGYYTSHYVMRAFAHLLGWFQLFCAEADHYTRNRWGQLRMHCHPQEGGRWRAQNLLAGREEFA